MNKDLSCTIVPYFQVQEGKLEAFKAITAKMVEQTETEPKCLYYSFYFDGCLLYTSPSPRDLSTSRMPSSA